jgi:RNA:NAD 2'-phosphotransferase (TPT1/KptA family)
VLITTSYDICNIVKIQVNGKGFYDCLVDTGAARSCIEEHFAKRVGAQILPADKNDLIFFISADGGAMKVQGKAILTLTIGNVGYIQVFHVLSNLTIDILLGGDFLLENRVTLDYDSRTLSLDAGLVQVPLGKRGELLGMAIVAENISIPPNTQKLVPVLTTRNIHHSLTLIEPIDNTNARGMKIAHTLVKSKGPKYCPVWNDSDEELWLHKNAPIGTLTSITDIIESIDENTDDSPFMPSSSPVKKHTFEELKIKLTNDKLTEDQKQKFRNLVDSYGDVFSLHNSELEGTDILEYEIQVPSDARPIRQKPYNQSEMAREEIRKQIQELLDIKFIRRSVSPWAANCLLVKKANGTYRMVVDYRALNRVVIPEIHAVPTFACITDTLSYSKPTILTSLDLRSGFHNLKVAESSVKYTGFQTFMGQFEYLRAPYGIQNIPAAMQRVMNYILSENEGPLMKYALAYLDDLLIFSPNIDTHFEHLEEVFRRLRSSKMKLNPSKCVFLVPDLIFLGNKICEGGIGPDPDKVKSMLEYPAPTNQKKLRSVLGLFQFYKKFIPGYSQKVIPLNRLLGHMVDFEWNDVEQKAFEDLREGLKNAPFLAFPSETDPYVLTTDASTKATGYILNQITPEGEERIIACGGRQLRKAEENYTITELELLSVIEAVGKYRHYLLGKEFTIRSDHLSLRFVDSLKDSGMGRLHRWSIYLSAFKFKIEYLKGVLNPVADALSRRDYPPTTDTTMDKLFADETINVMSESTHAECVSAFQNEGTILHPLKENLLLQNNLSTIDILVENEGNGKEKASVDISRNDIIQRIKRTLTYMLRHGAVNQRLLVDRKGFILIKDLIQWFQQTRQEQLLPEDLIWIVQTDPKNRFSLRDDSKAIRANQGHSFPVPELEVYSYELGENRYLVHHTDLTSLGSILQQGISRMYRNHVHLNPEVNQNQVKRGKIVAIYVDAQKAIEDGLVFVQAINGIILTKGDNLGYIRPLYFTQVKNCRTGELIHTARKTRLTKEIDQLEGKEISGRDTILNLNPSISDVEVPIEEVLSYYRALILNDVDKRGCLEEKLDNMDGLNLLLIEESDDLISDNTTNTTVNINPDYNLQELQRKCPDVGPMMKYLEEGILPKSVKSTRRILHEKDNYFLQDGILWHKQETRGRTRSIQEDTTQRVIPIVLRNILITGYHKEALCHAGFERTYMAITRTYYWNGMYKDIKRYIKFCLDCQAGKTHNLNTALLKPLKIAQGYANRLHIDYVGALITTEEGYKYIFTVIDSFTSYVWLFPTKDMTGETAAKCLIHVIKETGCFNTLISDQGQALIGKVVSSLSNLFGVTKIRTTPYRPESNSKIERMHRTLGNALRTTCVENRKWADKLPFIEMAFRATPIKGLGLSPFEQIHGGRRMLLPIDMQILERVKPENLDRGEYIQELRKSIDLIQKITTENIQQNQAEYSRVYNKTARPYKYETGQLVWLNDPIKKENEDTKIRRKWRGPFQIYETIEEHNVKLRNPSTGKIIERQVHVNRLKPCYLTETEEDVNEGIDDIDSGQHPTGEESEIVNTKTPASQAERSIPDTTKKDSKDKTAGNPISQAEQSIPDTTKKDSKNKTAGNLISQAEQSIPDTTKKDSKNKTARKLTSQAEQSIPDTTQQDSKNKTAGNLISQAEQSIPDTTKKKIIDSKNKTAGNLISQAEQSIPDTTKKKNPKNKTAGNLVSQAEQSIPDTTKKRVIEQEDEYVNESTTESRDDVYYEAIEIIKQKRLGGEKWYLIQWKEDGAKPSWSRESDVSEDLLKHWWITHTKEGTRRKRM